MSRRHRCQACRTAFVSEDDQPGRAVTCPKCGARQDAPAEQPKTATAPPSAPEASVFVPAERRAGGSRRLLRVAAGLTAVALAAVVLIVGWPAIKRWWNPIPPDPVEIVAKAYLLSLVSGNSEASGKLGTVELPPAIRTFRAVSHEKAKDRLLKGSFAPIAAFHSKLAETYDYDPAIGRYTPRNPLGAAAETLDALEEAKKQAEKQGIYRKMQSGNPEDVFDAAEAMAKSISSLSVGALAPRKLIPSYQQLVDDARPPLPDAGRELALEFGKNRETWDRLLKRPYNTLKADGPFQLEQAEVSASIIDSLGSLGDPPTPLHLTLTRFRLEGIDTGWKVTDARRGASREPEGEPSTPSPASNHAITP